MSDPPVPDSVARNVAAWTKSNADYTDGRAADAWSKEEITWGVFGVPEADVNALGDVAGLDVVELGCGTAYLSAWLAKRGARPVGVDPTPAQLTEFRNTIDKASGRIRGLQATVAEHEKNIEALKKELGTMR